MHMAHWPKDKDSALGHEPSYLQNIHRIVYIADHATSCHTQGNHHPEVYSSPVALGEASVVQAESLPGSSLLLIPQWKYWEVFFNLHFRR